MNGSRGALVHMCKHSNYAELIMNGGALVQHNLIVCICANITITTMLIPSANNHNNGNCNKITE